MFAFAPVAHQSRARCRIRTPDEKGRAFKNTIRRQTIVRSRSPFCHSGRKIFIPADAPFKLALRIFFASRELAYEVRLNIQELRSAGFCLSLFRQRVSRLTSLTEMGFRAAFHARMNWNMGGSCLNRYKICNQTFPTTLEGISRTPSAYTRLLNGVGTISRAILQPPRWS